MHPYQQLAEIYDADWKQFSVLLSELITRNFSRDNTTPRSVLDLGCGTGEILLLLKKNWPDLELCGIDLAPEMLRRAQQKLRKFSARLEVDNITDFHFSRKFDLCICAYDTINYLTATGDLRRVMSRVTEHIDTNGVFVLDFNTPFLYENNHHGSRHRKLNHIEFRQTLSYSRKTRLAKTIFEFAEGQEEHTQKAYYYGDIVTALQTAGLAVTKDFGDVAGGRRQKKSEKIIIFSHLTQSQQ